MKSITLRQWRKLSRAERNARVLFFRSAIRELWLNSEAEHAAGIREETERYHELNGRVNELWPSVPWTVHVAEYWTGKAQEERIPALAW